MVGDSHNASRGLLRSDADPVSKCLERAPHRSHVRLDLATDEIAGIDSRQHQVGIRGRRLHAAPAIGHRPRHGPGAARPDVQLGVLIHPSNAAAAVADLHDVHNGRHDRIASRKPTALDHVLAGDFHPVVIDEGALRRGAADVEGDDVRFANQLAQGCRTENAARRPGLDHGDRRGLGRCRRVYPAIGLHDVEGATESSRRQLALHAAEVLAGDGLNVGA